MVTNYPKIAHCGGFASEQRKYALLQVVADHRNIQWFLLVRDGFESTYFGYYFLDLGAYSRFIIFLSRVPFLFVEHLD